MEKIGIYFPDACQIFGTLSGVFFDLIGHAFSKQIKKNHCSRSTFLICFQWRRKSSIQNEVMHMVNQNPLTLIEKLINEHGILKEHLELLRDQISMLEKENSTLKSDNAILKKKQNETESQLYTTTKEIERLKQIIEGFKKNDAKGDLEQVTEKVLKLFFDTGRGLSPEEVAVFLSTSVNTAQHHLDLLSERDLIIQTRVGLESSRGRTRVPALFEITPSGRKYLVKNIRT